MKPRRPDVLLALAWGFTAALAAAQVWASLAASAPAEAVQEGRIPFIRISDPPAAAPAVAVPAPAQAVPRKALSPYAVGGHRSIDTDQVLRLIQAGELSDREAMEYGGAP